MVTQTHVLEYLRVALDLHFRQVFDIGSLGGRFADLEIVGRVGAREEEVAHVLVVDLEVGDADAVGDVGGGAGGGDALEEVFARAGDEAGLGGGAHHGVGLAGAGLAVGEDAGVVTFEVVVEEFFAERVVDPLLRGVVFVFGVVGPEGTVECEVFFFDDFSCLRPGVSWVG